MTIQNNSGGQKPGVTPGLRPHKVTNASSDRELILVWLGGKSNTTQASYNSTVTKFMEFIAKPLSEVKLEDLQLWERGLKGGGF
jgi:integrase/recombinase XerD